MGLSVLVVVLPRPQSSGRQLSSERSLEVKPLGVVQLLVNIPPTQVLSLEITVAQASWKCVSPGELRDEMLMITLLNCCRCWWSWRGGSSDVRECRAALLVYDKLKVINSNVAQDFVAPLGSDDNFVVQHRFRDVNSAQGPFRNSVFGGQIPEQFLAREVM